MQKFICLKVLFSAIFEISRMFLGWWRNRWWFRRRLRWWSFSIKNIINYVIFMQKWCKLLSFISWKSLYRFLSSNPCKTSRACPFRIFKIYRPNSHIIWENFFIIYFFAIVTSTWVLSSKCLSVLSTWFSPVFQKINMSFHIIGSFLKSALSFKNSTSVTLDLTNQKHCWNKIKDFFNGRSRKSD